MFDTEEDIKKKIMGATTDSDNEIKFDEENKPGISNLINIVVSITDYSISDIEEMFKGKGYGEFKRFVADITAEHIGNIQKKYKEIINSSEIDKILDEGIKKSRELARKKYSVMKERMGVVR